MARPTRRRRGRRRYSDLYPSSVRLELEQLEDRRLLTTTLFLDFGDPGAIWQASVADIDFQINGPDFTQVELVNFLQSDEVVTFRPLDGIVQSKLLDVDEDGDADSDDTLLLQERVVELVEQALEPFDIDVVVANPPAGSLDDVANLYSQNDGDLTGQNDSWVFVGELLADTTNAGGCGFALNCLFGLSGLASTIDFGGLDEGFEGSNSNDNAAMVFADQISAPSVEAFIDRLAYVVLHEAGHTWGLRHTLLGVNNSTDERLLTFSDLLAPENVVLLPGDLDGVPEDTFVGRTFTRYGLELQQDVSVTVPDVFINAYDQLADDSDIGLRDTDQNFIPDAAYITGTGTHDRITISNAGPNLLFAHIEPFRDAQKRPEDSLFDEGHLIDLSADTDGLLIIDAGFGDDEIVIEGPLEVDISVRGGSGMDKLLLRGNTEFEATYRPASEFGQGTITPSEGGAIEFHGTDEVVISNMTALEYETPLNSADDIEIDNPQPGVAFVFGTSETTFLTPLSFFNVVDFVLDTAPDGAGPADKVTVQPLVDGFDGNLETEANDTTGSPDSLFVNEFARGVIDPGGDVDVWSYDSVPAGALVFATAHTQFGACEPAGAESHLQLIGSDGETVLAQDNRDGPCVGSAIAGVQVPDAGEIFLRVDAVQPEVGVSAYELYYTVASLTNTASEIEPNHLISSATHLTPQQVESSTIIMGETTPQQGPGQADDVDLFSIFASQGARIVVMLDADPDGDGINSNLLLDIRDTGNDSRLLPSLDNDAIDLFDGDERAIAVVATAPRSGIFFIRIQHGFAAPDPQNYRFVVQVLDQRGPLENVTIETGAGDDLLNVNLPFGLTGTGELLWNAGGGLLDNDQLVINLPEGGDSITEIRPGVVEMLGSEPIHFDTSQFGPSNTVQLNTSDGNDLTHLFAEGDGLPIVMLDGGEGIDSVIMTGQAGQADEFVAEFQLPGMGQLVNLSTLATVAFANVSGRVAVDGLSDGADGDTLFVDGPTTSGETMIGPDTIYQGAIQRDQSQFLFQNIDALFVAGDPAANDLIHIQPLAIPVHIAGNGTEDRLVFSNQGPTALRSTIPAFTESSAAVVDFHPIPTRRLAAAADPIGAVGPAQAVSVVNSAIQLFDKASGNLLAEASLNAASGFFAVPDDPASQTDQIVFDPKVLFDPHSNRFIVAGLEFDNSHNVLFSRLYIAISTDATPQNLTEDWSRFELNVLDQLNGNRQFFDFPGLGVDENAIYLTGNMFQMVAGSPDLQDEFSHVSVIALDKTDLDGDGVSLLASSPAIDVLADLDIDGTIASTLQPVLSYGGAPADTAYFVGTADPLTNSIRVFTLDLSNPASPNIDTVDQLTVDAFDEINRASHKSGELDHGPIKTGDSRIQNAVYRDGSIYAAHTVDANADQFADARWYRIATNGRTGAGGGGTPSVEHQQDITLPDANLFYPAINVNADGHIAVGFSLASNDSFLGAAYGGCDPILSPGATDCVITGIHGLQAGQGPYEFVNRSGGSSAWGDYSGLSVDPVDNSFWAFNMFASGDDLPDTIMQLLQLPDGAQTHKGSWKALFGNFQVGLGSVHVDAVNASIEADGFAPITYDDITFDSGFEVEPLLEGLEAFQESLTDLNGHEQFNEPLQLVGASFGELLDMGQSFDQAIVDPLTAAGGDIELIDFFTQLAAANPNLQLMPTIESVASGQELRISGTYVDSRIDLQRPLNIDYTELTESELAGDLTNVFQLEFTFGLSIIDGEQQFFIEVDQLIASTTITNASDSPNGKRGFSEVDIESQQTFNYQADLSVEFTNPDGDPRNRLSREELLGNSVVTLAQLTPSLTNGLTIVIPVQTQIGTFTTAGTNPLLTIESVDPFDLAPPTHTWNNDAAELENFHTVESSNVAEFFDDFGNWLQGLMNADEFDLQLPFASGISVSGLVDVGEIFSAHVGDLLFSAPETPNFASAQQFAALLGATVFDYQPLTNQLILALNIQHDFDALQLPLNIGFDISPAGAFESNAAIDVDVSANLDVVFGIDLTPLGSSFTLLPTMLLSELNDSSSAPFESGDELAITFRNGQTLDIDFNALPANPILANLLTLLNSDARMSANIDADNDSLRLVDHTSGDDVFTADFGDSVSLAVAAFGLIGQDEDYDGVLLGKPLHGDRLIDHFFIQEADLSGTIALSGSNIDATASLLGAGIELSDGTLNATVAFEVSLTDPGTPDANSQLVYDQRITIGEMADGIFGNTTTSPPIALDSLLFSPQVSGNATLQFLDVMVTGFPSVLPASPFLTIDIDDVTDLSTTQVSHNLEMGDLQGFDISTIVGLLDSVASFLGTISGANLFDVNLPIIEQSVGQLLNLPGPLEQVVNGLQSPPLTFAELETAIEDLLNVPASGVSLNFDPDTHLLELSLAFDQQFTDSLPLNLDLASFGIGGLPDFVDAGGSGNIDVEILAAYALNLGLDLTNPLSPQPYIEDSSGIDIDFSVRGTNLAMSASVGPLGVFVENGRVTLDADGAPGGGDASLMVALHSTAGGRYDLTGIGISDVDTTLNAGVNIGLPVYAPNDGTPLDGGGDAGNGFNNLLSAAVGDLADFFAGDVTAPNVTYEIPNIADALANLDLLSNLTIIVDGLDWLLGKVQKGLNQNAFSKRLPLIGNALQNSGQFIEDIRLGFVQDLQDYLEVNPATPTALRQGLFELLGPLSTIGILTDSNGDLAITVDDVGLQLTDEDGDGTNDDVRFEVLLGRSLPVAMVPLGFDIGFDALGLDVDASIELALEYDWRLAFGINKTLGFYIDTSTNNELQIALEATIPDASFVGNLGFLQIEARDALDDPSHLTAAFEVDLVETGGDDRLTFGELTGGNDFLEVSFDAMAEAVVNLDLRLSFGGNTMFPSLVAGFHLDWSLSGADLASDSANFGGPPHIVFQDVGVDLGSFISDFAGPIVRRLRTVLDPIKPAIDVLQTRVPILSDIKAARQLLNRDTNPDVSILELALHLGVGGEQLEYVNDFVKVYNLIDKLDQVATIDGENQNLVIPVGSFDLGSFDPRVDDVADVGIDDFLPVNISSEITELIDTLDDAGFADTVKDFFDSSSSDMVPNAGGLLEGMSPIESVFEFRIIEHPEEALLLLLGRDPTLVSYNLKPLEASFTFHKFIPIFWWLGVEIDGGLGVEADLEFGYDTRGVRDFVESGFDNPLHLLNGFFINDLVDGVDVPEVTLWGFLSVAGALDAVVASASVGGGINATIEGNLNDLDGDGKFRGDELLETLPFCMLDIHGELTAGAFARVKIGLGKLSYTKRWNIAEKTLAEFDYHCELNQPVLATDMGGGVLRLNLGPDADKRIHGNTDGDADETFEITHVSGPAGNEIVLVSAFGYEQEYAGVSQIIGDGGGGNDRITFASDVQAAVAISGSEGDDVLVAGAGPAVFRGGTGLDQLTGGPAVDQLFGDDDDDLLVGGGGDDFLSGGKGNDELYGEDGNDSLEGDSGNDFLFGDEGNDTISGGEGDDLIEGGAGNDILRGFSGSDTINGGLGDDYIEGGTQDDIIIAGIGNDTVRGGGGADTILGGPGNDDLDGDTGNDQIEGEDGDDTLRGNAGNDTLIGGLGNDVLFGGSGRDVIEGNEGNDTAFGGSGNDELFGGSGADELHGDTGDDLLEGGTGNDQLFGDAGHDRLLGQENNDTLEGGTGQDLLEGSTGNDILRGGSGIDRLLGEAGNDELYGDAGDDLLLGHAGNDLLHGGPGRDRLEAADGDDTLYGGDDSDLLIGDFGFDRLLGGFGNDVIYSHLPGDRSTTNDEYIEGGPDDDFICGTDGHNEIYGGTADLGYDGFLSPVTVPTPLSGGFTPLACESDDNQVDSDFPYEPEIDLLLADFVRQIQGRKFLDWNGNGISESGEGGFGGVVIYADLNVNGALDAGEPNTITEIDGSYSLDDVPVGTLAVREIVPAGFVATSPPGGLHLVEMGLFDVVEHVDFGNSLFGGISGRKWNDVNGEGTWNIGEPPLAGVTVYLDLNGNGQLDGAEPQDITDATGHYDFAKLAPGQYFVRETTPDEFVQTFPVGHLPHIVDVVGGETTSSVNFGNFREQSFGGVKWSDLDGDGTRDTGEPGLPGVTIYLDLNFNGALDDFEPQTLTTEDDPGTRVDEAGQYRFVLPLDWSNPEVRAILEQNPGGPLFVRELVPVFHQQTFPTIGFHAVDPRQRDLPSFNFGNQPQGAIYGTKWDDRNANGHWDADEPGLPDVLIYLDFNQNGSYDAGEPLHATRFDDPATPQDETGRYAFTGLPLGKYFVEEVVPFGYTQSYPISFTHTIVFEEPGFVEDIDFGNFRHGEINGTKWVDRDGDGLRDAGEPGLPGVIVYSDVNSNGRFDEGEPSAVTLPDDVNTSRVDENGTYRLTGLVPGKHTIREVSPFGYVQTSPPPVLQDRMFVPGAHSVTLQAGETVPRIDFGNEPRFGNITGLKWNDRDGDGIHDANEVGLSGVTIYLDVNRNGVADPSEPQTVTRCDNPATSVDESGTYLLPSVPAGVYIVREIVPMDWRQTYPIASGAHTVTVGALQTSSRIDFGNRALNSQTEPPFATCEPGPAALARLPLEPFEQAAAAAWIGDAAIDHGYDIVKSHMTDARPAMARADIEALLALAHSADGYPIEPKRQPIALNGPADFFDFGDLPSPFPTLLADNGARHEVLPGNTLFLGNRIDTEPNGQPHLFARGDELVESSDEDGVTFNGALIKGNVASVTVVASGAGFLNAWLDANGDGDWQDAGEQIFVARALNAGPNTIQFVVPAGDFPLDFVANVAARFRFSSASVLSYTGLATNGEVEDYALRILGQEQPPVWDAELSISDSFRVEGNAGLASMQFVVTLSQPVAHPVTVAYATADGTALAALDYLQTSGSLVISPGVQDGVISVPIIGELLFEPVETFFVRLTQATGATIVDDTGVGLIENDDTISNGSVRGAKWLDQNENGIRDLGEPGEPGVRIYVDLLPNQVWDPFEPSTITQATGQYQLSGVPVGNWSIREVLEPGWTQTFPPTGSHAVVVGPGSNITGLNFGNIVRLPDGDDEVYAAADDDLIYGDNLVLNHPEVRSVGTRRDALYGESGQDQIFGQERDDLLIGGEDADDLDGGGDIDRVWQAVDADQTLTDILLTGQGPDSLINIERATLIGGAGGNTIDASEFTLGPVTLIGLDGDDHLIGSPQGDELVGGNGSDLVDGRDGDDVYLFDAVTSGVLEQDTLTETAGGGRDTLDFTSLLPGNDVTVDLSQTIVQQFGNHLLREILVPAAVVGQQPEFERLLGGAGADHLTGNDANNDLFGNVGIDHLIGGPGRDLLDGGADFDTLEGGTGDDRLEGGTENDWFVFAAAWGSDIVTDGGGTSDHVDFSAVATDLTVDIGSLTISDGVNTMTHLSDEIERVTTGSGGDLVRFLHGGALLAGGAGVLDAGPGTDTLSYELYSAAASAIVNLSLGTAAGVGRVFGFENVTGGDGPDVITGDAGDNVLRGGLGNDTLSGRNGDDQLLGEMGDDLLTGGFGNDLLRGGDNDDTYLFGFVLNEEHDVLAEVAGQGVDTLNFSGHGASVSVDMTNDQLLSAATSGRELTVEIAGQAANLENVVGTLFNDEVIINGADNRIAGGRGDDQYVFPDGLTGMVRLLEGPDEGSDQLNFTQFTTPITFDLGLPHNTPALGLDIWLWDLVPADAPEHFEQLIGGAHDDVLRGNSSDNQIAGSGGADRLSGGAGRNVLDGGDGDDTYLFDETTVDIVLRESDLLTGGADTLDFSAVPEGVTINLDLAAAQQVSPLGRTVTLDGELENIVGTAFADTIRAAALPQQRLIDGGHPVAPALPADTLTIDAAGAAVSFDGNDVLLDGILSITYVNIESLGVENAAEITVDAGIAADDGVLDAFTVARNASNTFVIVNGQIVLTTPAATAPPIGIIGSGDDDVLLVSFAQGSPIPQGLTFSGESQVSSDTLILFGAGSQSGVYIPDPKTFGNGTVNVGPSTIAFTGLEPVIVHGMESFTFVSAGSQDNLIVDSPDVGKNRILGTSDGVPFEELVFYNVSQIIIDVEANDVDGQGDDQITFQSDLVATGLDSLSVMASATDDVDSSMVSFAAFLHDGVWTFVSPTSILPGDFNGDLQVNASDIDLIFAAIANSDADPVFDLDNDGQLNNDDTTYLIEEILGTRRGDVNLDKSVDASDFNVWNNNKFTEGTGWMTGDFNGDRVTDVSDFNIWNENRFVIAAADATNSRRAPRAPLPQIRQPVASDTVHVSDSSVLMPTANGDAEIRKRLDWFGQHSDQVELTARTMDHVNELRPLARLWKRRNSRDRDAIVEHLFRARTESQPTEEEFDAVFEALGASLTCPDRRTLV